MFTLLSVGMVVSICVVTERRQNKDSDDTIENIKHSRQDLRLIAYLLFAALVMLGVIADRLH
jgi:hypothetical protein